MMPTDMKGNGHSAGYAHNSAPIINVRMADFNNAWVEIFKAGDYGDKGVWPVGRLDQVVQNFHTVSVVNGKPRRQWTPPAVLGHPAEDAPAYGWVSDLKREGEVLLARFSKVQPALEASVKDGRFPNRSAAFYLDPQGKGPVLRHVGFLGSVPPEVKSLEPIHFSDGEFIAIEFDESRPGGGTQEETMSEKKPDPAVGGATSTLSAEQVGIITRFYEGLKNLFTPPVEKGAATFSEAEVNAKMDQMRKEMEGKMSELAKSALATTSAAQLTAFAERLTAKKVAPAIAGPARLIAEAILNGAAELTFTEGEGDKKTEKKVGLFQAFCDLIEANAAIVPTGEVAGAAAAATGKGKVLKFNETRDLKVDPESEALNAHAEAIAAELQQKNPKLTDLAAFKEGLAQARVALSSGAAPGGMAAGKV